MRQPQLLPFSLVAGALFAFSCTTPTDQNCSPYYTVTTDASVDGLPLDGPGDPRVCIAVCSAGMGECHRIGSNTVKCTNLCP